MYVPVFLRPRDLVALPWLIFVTTILLLMFIDNQTARFIWDGIGLFLGLVTLIGVSIMRRYIDVDKD
ncbi:hypothetical protein ACAW68_02060 [Weissella confusa]|uniref:hypothetical protein n=1 Tax=Weissella confusa TaxID=1583 RepID=UPI0035A26260